MIDVGTTGMGAGMPGGMGAKIRHAHPEAIDELAADFPNLTIIAAHPGWPWVDEMTAVALHKGNVYWELSGWAPKYFPPQLKVDARSRLKDKIMFGSDYPSLPYERIFREWKELGYADEWIVAAWVWVPSGEGCPQGGVCRCEVTAVRTRITLDSPERHSSRGRLPHVRRRESFTHSLVGRGTGRFRSHGCSRARRARAGVTDPSYKDNSPSAEPAFRPPGKDHVRRAGSGSDRRPNGESLRRPADVR